jgi:DNA mismatch repair protein MutS
MNPTTFDELERFVSILHPSETILISFLSDKETQQIASSIKTDTLHIIAMQSEPHLEKRTSIENCQKQTFIQHILSTVFGSECYQICKEFSQFPTATQSFCYLLHFFQERNPDLVKKMCLPQFFNTQHRILLANHTLQQLNIIDDHSIDGRQSGKFSSVSSFLNRCCTPMGRRAFQHQITNPTSNLEWLNTEYTAISQFLREPQETIDTLRRQLRTIKDLEKICRQTVMQKVYPNTIYQLFQSMTIIAACMDQFSAEPVSTYLHAKSPEISKPISEFIGFLSSVLFMDRCKNVETLTNFQENIFRPGNFANLDQIVSEYQQHTILFDTIRKTLNDIMQSKNDDDTDYIKVHETEKSGMSLQMTKRRAEVLRGCLKGSIVFGSYTVDAKEIRFVKAGSASTEEIEFPLLTTVLNQLQKTKEKMSEEIAKTFLDVLRTLEQTWYDSIEGWIRWTIRLDILQTKTHIARKYGYCCPQIEPSEHSFLNAKGIRHVLIEHIQQNEVYVANDVHLGLPYEHDGILLFGTNAVGKTSLIRAIGICIIMAQTGCFVPCISFVFQPYTAIFSRILGNDNLFKGLSTFAVEMSELRVILKTADKNSLVLGDELCSGTEMESALSLFSAGLIELAKKGATFLFATHFHEITKYDEIQQLTRLGLKHMAVRYDPSTQSLLYDRLLKDGQGSRIYGLEVCRSLYMDPTFLDRAYALRNKYFPEQKGELNQTTSVYNAKKIRGKCEICHKEMSSETHHLASQELADSAGFIGGFHKNHPGNLAAVCETCHLSIHRENKQMVKKKTTKGYTLQEKGV